MTGRSESGGVGRWNVLYHHPCLRNLAEVLAQRTHELRIGIEWVGGLVYDKHAPPSVATSWGLFSINERSPEPLRGHVTVLEWWLSESLPIVQAQHEVPPRNEELDHLRNILAGHLR